MIDVLSMWVQGGIQSQHHCLGKHNLREVVMKAPSAILSLHVSG